MRAVVVHDYNDASVEELPRPDPEPNEVLVAINRVQLSVTECRLYRGEDLVHGESVANRLAEGPSQLFGHEFCGVVEETGEEVTTFAIGDRVYAPGKIFCGECAFCTSGSTHLCPNKIQIGYDRPGATAEYLAVPTEPLARLPEQVSDAEGAAMQPFSHAVVCAYEAGIETGDVVAVIGTGVMGYQMGQLALQHGASRVFAVDVVPEKLDLAAGNGMIPIDARDENPVERIRSATDEVGADIVIEAVGGDQSAGTTGTDPLAQAYQIARYGGQIVQVGHILGDVTLRPGSFRAKSVDWLNPSQGVRTTGPNTNLGRIAPELVANDRVSIAEYVTHELDDGLAAFDDAVDRTLDQAAGLGPAQMVVRDD